jgi:hypothetical protein
MVGLTGWRRLKKLARGEQGKDEEVRMGQRSLVGCVLSGAIPARFFCNRGVPVSLNVTSQPFSCCCCSRFAAKKQPVLRRCWTFLSDCASAAVQDVVQQVSPIPVHDLGALTGFSLGRDGQRNHGNIEIDVQWAVEDKDERAALDRMEVDLGSLDPGLLKDPVAANRPAEGSSCNDKHESERGGPCASGGSDKRFAGTHPATNKAANDDGEKPTGPGAPNGGSNGHVAVTPPTAKSAANHSKRSGRCVKRPPRFEEDEEAVAADAVATKIDQKRPRARSEHCYAEAQVGTVSPDRPPMEPQLLSSIFLTILLLPSDRIQVQSGIL